MFTYDNDTLNHVNRSLYHYTINHLSSISYHVKSVQLIYTFGVISRCVCAFKMIKYSSVYIKGEANRHIKSEGELRHYKHQWGW